MTPDVVAELNKEGQQSEFHQTILRHAMGLIQMSRIKMSEYYEEWDMQDQVYRGMRCLDKEDQKQALQDKPVKMVVPNTFAQVMTFSSFLFLLFTQNRNYFELIPTGEQDYGDKQQDISLFLDRDLKHNQWNLVLFQHLLDIGRFGPGILECSWTRKTTNAFITPEPRVVNFQGIETTIRPESQWQEFVKYEGNLIRNVSPYRFFPDTRFPLTEFQRGEFCAAEEEYSIGRLRDLEKAGEVAGVGHIQPLPANFENIRGAPTRMMILSGPAQGYLPPAGVPFLAGPAMSEGVTIVTKCQIWIVPSKFRLHGDVYLGPEEFPVLYHLWYANDNRVIRIEPAMWWHNQFGWSVSQFTPDMHHTITLGLADLIYRLQDVITWHINSRITDVRRNMHGRLVVDPSGVDTVSLDNGDGDIYLRGNASKSGVDRWLKQLAVTDVTAGHLGDAELLGKIMQVVTGVNDNIMGQYNQGRRSAQESRTVLSGAAGRMKLHGSLIWESSMNPLGKMMMSNQRQALSYPSFRLIVDTPDEGEAQQRFANFKGTPAEVICGDDYFVFDSTLQSEKGFTAQSLQELLSAIIQSDPMAAQRLTENIDPAKIVEEIQYLRGAGNIKRFRYSPEEKQQIQAERQAKEAAAQEANKEKPRITLSGKLTSQHEAAAATVALGVPMREGKPQDAPKSSNGNGSK